MPGRIFLANVGANASHRFTGPIFPDQSFEFLPIPEGEDLQGPHPVRFKDLRSHYDPKQELTRFIPKRLWDFPAHYDPEFESFTYGDNCELSPRAASLKKVESGDFLFFIARLRHWSDDRPTKTFGFYLIGFLEIEEILRDVQAQPGSETMKVLGANAHIRRGLSDSTLWDRFWVFKGTATSQRFQKAVPITREIANKVFMTADGDPWTWDDGRSDLQVIGSYTRSCRCVIDPGLPGHQNRADALWDWVRRYSC